LHLHNLATLLDHLVTAENRNQNAHQDKEKDSHDCTSAKRSSGHRRNIAKQSSTRGCFVAVNASVIARADAQVVQALSLRRLNVAEAVVRAATNFEHSLA
jgi:hypothetical protein